MVVTLTSDGGLQIREETIPASDIVTRLMALRATEGDKVVYVRADKARAYGDVMEMLGKVGEAGYGRVSLLAQPQGPPRPPATPPPQ